MQLNEKRLWYRLVGLRHDVIEWKRLNFSPSNPFLVINFFLSLSLSPSFFQPLFSPSPDNLYKLQTPYHPRTSEGWIAEALEPVRKVLLQKVKLFQSQPIYGDSPVAHLAGLMYEPGTEDPDDEEENSEMSGNVFLFFNILICLFLIH